MSQSTPRARRHIILVLFCVLAGASGAPDTVVGQDEIGEAAAEASGTTVIYDQAFFRRFSNAVTARDLIERIPGGGAILDAAENGEARGFSRNADFILIDGKRIAGKQNSGGDALDRISVEQIERIELIRGASPDVKVSTQEAIINVVLVEGADTGSGSWRATVRFNPRGQAQGGAAASYGRSFGRLDVLGSLEYDSFPRTRTRRETTLDGQGRRLRLLDERLPRTFWQIIASANATYSFDNGDQLRFNGQVEIEDFDRDERGDLLDPVGGETVIGRAFRFDESEEPSFEVGIDYTAALSPDWRLELLALRSQVNDKDSQGEDPEVTGDEPEVDFIFRTRADRRETIGRASIAFGGWAGHELEVGSEYAVNVVDSTLELEERVNGVLRPVTVPGAEVRVQEDRSESFLIDTWQIAPRLSLESSLFFEISEIAQDGSGIGRARSFQFLRPSADLRFDITTRQQLQFTIRRDVDQLEFGDFASSVSEDDEVVAGNEDLVPEKSWVFQGEFEYRLAEDQGTFALSLFHERIGDAIERVEVLPGISGVGNVGNATKTGVGFEGNLRLGFLGLPEMLIEAEVDYLDSSVTDAFTGGRRPLNFQERWEVAGNFRHDVESLGLSYGLNYFRSGFEVFHDIDEIIFLAAPQHFLDFFAEISLWRGINLRFEANNLIDSDDGRRRELFRFGRPGPLTGVELRRQSNGRTMNFSLNGVF